MLRKTFAVYNNEPGARNLFIEAGKKYIALLSKNADTNVLHSLEFFQFNENDKNNSTQFYDDLKKHSELMQKDYTGKQLICDSEECVCIPSAFYTPELADEYLKLIFGSEKSNNIFCRQLNDFFVLAKTGSQLFSAGDAIHQYYLLVKNFLQPENNEDYVIQIIFYPDHYIFLAQHKGLLNLVQTRAYASPEDVLYFVLNFCRQYNFSLASTVVACGMIDEKSKLFNTLYQYLPGFSLEKADVTLFHGESFKEFPFHFFSHFSKYEMLM